MCTKTNKTRDYLLLPVVSGYSAWRATRIRKPRENQETSRGKFDRSLFTVFNQQCTCYLCIQVRTMLLHHMLVGQTINIEKLAGVNVLASLTDQW